MDKPISVGDLVRITHACCDPKNVVGYFEEVTRISNTSTDCGRCRTPHHGAHAWFRSGNHYGFPVAWLKRIPPLADLEGVLAQGEIKHPITGKVPA